MFEGGGREEDRGDLVSGEKGDQCRDHDLRVRGRTGRLESSLEGTFEDEERVMAGIAETL
jgi:hypothetical protein